MAGLGIKKFVSGETLTADEVNGYLMDQAVCVFETTSARDLAFTGGSNPSLSEGRVCYIKATNKVQYYDGSNWIDSEQFSVSLNSQVSPGILQLDRLVSGTPGQIVVCNSSGVPTYVTLQGATMSSSGSISITNDTVELGTDTTGNYVATIAGTTNQITVTGSGSETAAVTLSLPQDIHAAANPTFAGITSGSVRVGITADNEIDTTSGNLILDSTGGTVSIDDILSVSGSTSISGAASVAGLLTAASNAAISGSISVAGAASVAGLLTAASNVAVSGSAAVTGNVVYHISTSAVANSGSITTAMDGQLVELGAVSGAVGLHYVGGTGWTVGSQITVMQMSGTASTSASIVFPGSQTVRGTPVISSSVAVLRAQYSSATLINRGTNDWFIIGDLRS